MSGPRPAAATPVVPSTHRAGGLIEALAGFGPEEPPHPLRGRDLTRGALSAYPEWCREEDDGRDPVGDQAASSASWPAGVAASCGTPRALASRRGPGKVGYAVRPSGRGKGCGYSALLSVVRVPWRPAPRAGRVNHASYAERVLLLRDAETGECVRP